MTKKILIVDDEQDIRILIGGLLEDEGYTVTMAENSTKAYEAIEQESPDLVILDIWLESGSDDGIAVLKNIKKKHEILPVIMISGHGTIETAVSTIKYGAYDFIEKPFKSDRLLLMVHRALENSDLRKENAALKKHKTEQHDVPIKYIPNNVKTLLDKVSVSNSRALITGEVGTGKIFAAQYIHEHSSRHDKEFVVFNCSQSNAMRVENELFNKGLLELAHNGTLVLDEVGMLPIETQGKLLHFIQEASFYKTGMQTKTFIDARIIATSSQDIPQQIVQKKFREDLFYRLNVVPISLLPLRKRKEDIVEIITNESTFTFSAEALCALKKHDWPGNTKQLHNILEWLKIMHGKDKTHIEFHDLPPAFHVSHQGAHPARNDNHDTSAELLNLSELMSLSLRDARESFERSYIQRQIDKFDGNISKTASFIGMERSALHRKLKSLDIFSDDKQNSA